MEKKLKLIREKCIEANPEIVELTFGCRVEIQDEGENYEHGNPIHRDIVTRAWRNSKDSDGFFRLDCLNNTYNIRDGDMEIIGRPIRLADVLLAMKKKRVSLAIRECGCFMQYKYIEDDEGSDWYQDSFLDGQKVSWNLKDNNLENQNEPTKNFIWGLLK